MDTCERDQQVRNARDTNVKREPSEEREKKLKKSTSCRRHTGCMSVLFLNLVRCMCVLRRQVRFSSHLSVGQPALPLQGSSHHAPWREPSVALGENPVTSPPLCRNV